ncbi:MAG: Smr/MutS family protein [Rhodanobacter sp.]
MKRVPTQLLLADDSRLFREAVGDVRRLVSVPPPAASKKAAPRPRRRHGDESMAAAQCMPIAIGTVEPGAADQLSYLREGYSPKLLRQLKRGRCTAQDELDLHGMTVRMAQSAINNFLAEAKQMDWCCVRIVHGKGLRSTTTRPVLKGLANRMLRQHDDVIAFSSAALARGGTGAVVVLLKT